VFGLAFQYADYGKIGGDDPCEQLSGFLDIGTIKPNAYSVGLGYARALTDKFSVGGNVKYVRQDLGVGTTEASYIGGAGSVTGATLDGQNKNALDVVAFDFGLIYQTGYKSLNIGMSVRNFAREVKYQKESFQLPSDVPDRRLYECPRLYRTSIRNQHSLLVTVDAEHPRDFPEQMKVGLEYVFMDLVAARIGYGQPG